MKTATKNTTATATATKVGVHQLSECLAEWEVICEATATKLGAWVRIGTYILEDGQRGLQAEFIARTGANKGDVSNAVKVAYAQAESLANGDDGFDWEDYTSLQNAVRAARAYLNGEDAPVKKSRKGVAVKQNAQDIIKSLGKAEAKKLALDILASL